MLKIVNINDDAAGARRLLKAKCAHFTCFDRSFMSRQYCLVVKLKLWFDDRMNM